MRAVVLPAWGGRFQAAPPGYWAGLARVGVNEVTVLRPDSDPGCADFTADEPFLLLWDGPRTFDLSAAVSLHRARRGAVTLVLAPRGEGGAWLAAPDGRGRVNYLEADPPTVRCEEVLACAGAALCEPMPGIPLPRDGEELLELLRFWMDRGELWGALSGLGGSLAAMGEEVTENPLYFL